MGLVPILFSPLGFLIVVLGQAELFTAHTVSGVAATLKDFGYWRSLIRLWVVVFVFNVLGTAFFAALVVYGKVLPPSALGYLLDLAGHIQEFGFWSVVLRSVLGDGSWGSCPGWWRPLRAPSPSSSPSTCWPS